MSSFNLATYTDSNGLKVWTVMSGGSPLVAARPDRATAVATYQRYAPAHLRGQPMKLWDGDAGEFSEVES